MFTGWRQCVYRSIAFHFRAFQLAQELLPTYPRLFSFERFWILPVLLPAG